MKKSLLNLALILSAVVGFSAAQAQLAEAPVPIYWGTYQAHTGSEYHQLTSI